MMEQKNIAEILKDCPTGMELDCAVFDNVYFNKVDNHLEFPIECYILCGERKLTILFTKYGEYSILSGAKCVIFPKGKTTWERFVPPCKFKDGDVVAGENCVCSYITIFRKFIDDTSFSYHVCLTSFGNFKVDDFSNNANLRLATEEEKAKLFDAIKDYGYKWNEKTKTLEKLIELKFKVGNRVKKNKDYISGIVTDIFDDSFKVTYDGGGCSYVQFHCQDDWELVPDKFDIATLKPFDRVLVRDNNTQKWTADLFSFYDRSLVYPYSCVGHYTNQCVPYEKNEHLLGTTDDCDKYYKNW